MRRAFGAFCMGMIAVALWSTLDARAQDRRVSLEEALQLFAANNLELQDSRARAMELSGLARQAAGYPNPFATVTHEPLWRGGDPYSETYLNLSQRLVWPGLRSARVDAAEQLARAAYADLQADSSRLVFEVAEAYTRAVAADHRRDVLETATEIFRRADRSNELMVVEGEVSGYRLRRLRVERARYETRLAVAELDVQDARRRLALLIIPDAATVIPTDDLRDIPTNLMFEAALRQARQHRAELRSAQADVEAARASLEADRLERLPDPTFTAGFKRQSDGFRGMFLGTSLPLPVFNRNQGAIEAGAARLTSAEKRLALAEARIEHDVRRAYEKYASLADRVDLISRSLLGEADALLSSARVGYVEGEMSLVELLDAAEAYSDARLSSLDLTTDLHVAYFDLLRAAGGHVGDVSFRTSK